MAINRKALSLLASIFLFTSCHNMCSELEEKIGTTCWNEKLYWEDVSSKTYSFSGNKRFAMTTDNGEPAIKVSSGSGNWVLSSLGNDIKGYEVQVKCVENASLAGCQLFSKSNYSAFEVYIKKGGLVEVRYQDKSSNDTKLYTSKKIIDDITVYNTISVKLQDDRSVKVYCNGQYIYTIKGYSINYGQLAMQMDSSGNTYYKIKKVMH